MNCIEILQRLVALPSISDDSNLPLIEFVRAFLAERGIGCQLIHDASGRKANLLARIGPATDDGVILSGHTDVVPVDGQRWSGDPFELRERGSRLYGRGTADMKGFLACALAAADKASRLSLRRPLYLAFSHDEEIGCVGVRSMLAQMSWQGLKARLCIAGEPTSMRAAIGHKGKLALEVTCHAQAGHSANAPMMVSAIHMASDLIQRLRQRQHEMSLSGPRDGAYPVPYPSLHVGTVSGGVALNVVPPTCTMQVEIRYPGCADPQQIMAAVGAEIEAVQEQARRQCPHARIEVRKLISYPALNMPADDDSLSLLRRLLGDGAPLKVSFGSEAGLYRERLGIPAVVCGPGSIEQAHQPDEYVERDQLMQCERFLDALLADLVR